MNYASRKSLYLERYGDSKISEITKGNKDIGHFIVIPAYKESDLKEVLKSIIACDSPTAYTEVIILINYREDDEKEYKSASQNQFEEITEWARLQTLSDRLSIDIPPPVELDKKKGGVGWARKIGMDLAIARSKQDSIITCLDADCKVSSNYLQEIERHFDENPTSPGASIYFEHPLENENRTKIVQYELHLRYYNQAQRFAGFPWAFHTVGSAMTVRSSAYMKQGGMNRRRAGEDFYFIHKIIALGGFMDISETIIYPSARESDRVPFGTGHAMKKEDEIYLSYPFAIFEELKSFLQKLEFIYNSGGILEGEGRWYDYLRKLDAEEDLKSLVQKSRSFKIFEKHFYHWCSAFKVMKYCNEHERSEVVKEAKTLLAKTEQMENTDLSTQQLLLRYRDLERKQKYESILDS